jgi:gamma-glutamyltranspeptidase/glutathione hydrolase
MHHLLFIFFIECRANLGCAVTIAAMEPVHPGLVAAPQAEAAYEGARVLSDGGNAADALVTAALVQGVVDPHRSGLGGFGCATVLFPARGGPLSIDFHGRAGSRARPDQWEGIFESAAPDGFGYVVRGKLNDVGYASITVPGMVAGIGEIHRRFGSMPWRDLVLRAVRPAEEGFLVTPDLAEFWIRPGLHGRVSTRDRLGHTPTGREITLREDGAPYRAGEIFRQPLLAATYRRLAGEGPEGFYRGRIAADISRDWEANGALVTGEDLADYRPSIREPLAGRYRGAGILTTPLPGGGVALLQALALSEDLDLRALGHNTAGAIDRVGRVLQAVWADRLANHGDPAFGGRSAEELLDPSYLASLRAGRGVPAGADSGSTTQLTIVDGNSNAVSFSHSLGYGSGVFSPELGFMYNNCMSAFDPRPGRRNSIAPGKTRTTAVAETIVLRGEQPWIVLGSPGAARITAGLVETITNIVDFGMTAAEAVVHPRFDAYGEKSLVLDSRFPQPLVRELRGRGWDVIQSPKPFGVVGRVYAIELDPDGKRAPIAGVDPGEPGAAFRART